MNGGTSSGFFWLIPVGFILIGVVLGLRDMTRAEEEKRQKQKGADASLLMLSTISSDTTSTPVSSGPEISHHCDPGFHVGGFDSGCSSHH